MNKNDYEKIMVYDSGNYNAGMQQRRRFGFPDTIGKFIHNIR